jgi:hypothetical protein
MALHTTNASIESPLPQTLGAFQQYFWIREQVASNGLLFWAELNGVLEEPNLRAAINRLQIKYPLLHAKVVRQPGTMPTFVEDWTPIPLHVVSASLNLGLEPLIEKEMAEGSAHTLFRVVLLQSEEQRIVLMFVTNHAITDARGAAILLRDLLSLLDAQSIGEPVNRVRTNESLFDEPAIREYSATLPPNAAAAVAKSELRQVHARTIELCPEETAKLVSRARQENVTVQGALMAAAVKSAQISGAGWQDGRILHMLVPIDLRRFDAREESTDLLTHPVYVPIQLMGARDFWDLARDCKTALNQRITRDEVRAFIQNANQLVACEWEPGAFFDATNGGLPHELFVSNIGDIGIPVSYGALAIQSIGFCNLSGPPPTQTICVATLHGRMCLAQVSYQPYEQLLAQMRSLLIEASS